MSDQLVPAGNFILTVEANVDNEKISDAQFREFIRNSLPIVKEVVENKNKIQALSKLVFDACAADRKDEADNKLLDN